MVPLRLFQPYLMLAEQLNLSLVLIETANASIEHHQQPLFDVFDPVLPSKLSNEVAGIDSSSLSVR